MAKLKLGAALALALLSVGVNAAPKATPDIVTLGTIDGEADDKLSAINIRLDHKPTWTAPLDVQNHGSFLQLVLPDTIVPDPGHFYDGVNPWLPKVAVYQLTPSDAGVRLFVSQDANLIKQALTAEVLGSRVVITLDNAKLAGLVAAATPVAAPAATSAAATSAAATSAAAAPAATANNELVGPPALNGADAVIARTAVRHDIPPPSDMIKKDDKAAKAAPLALGGLDLREKLVKVAVFSGFMLVLMGLSWAARPLLRRHRRLKSGAPAEAQISMKTIASLPLAARQKVSLIQVGDEKILIGVTPEAVTFLTTIGASGFGSMAAAMAPGGARLAGAQRFSPLSFQQTLGQSANENESVELHQAPVLKRLEGNDPETLRQPKKASGTAPSPKSAAAAAAPTPPASPTRPNRGQPSPNGAPLKVKRAAGSRINVGVGEDGIQDLRSRPAAPTPPAAPATTASREAPAEGQQAIDDVTRLIREKLKTLRTI